MTRRVALARLGIVGGGIAVGGCSVAARMGAPVSPAPAFADIDLTLGGVRVRSVRTGAVAVKQAHRALLGPAATRLPSIVFDPRWTAWMPNTAWLVEHPDRTILVDAGETPRVHTPDYFACDAASAFVYERLLRFDVPRGVADGLTALGVPSDAVDAVVMTHFHSDHAGGLGDIGDAEVLASRTSTERPAPGSLPCRWPPGFAPTALDYTDGAFGAFAASHALVPDGSIRAVPTPGHTRGHQSVLITDGARWVCLAGDASFDRAQVERDQVAGICDDVPMAHRTLAVLREQLGALTVYLASHDPAPDLSPLRAAASP